MSCKHMGRLVNQGVWWCDLKDENGKQMHPECDCTNCKDFDELTYITVSSSASICIKGESK